MGGQEGLLCDHSRAPLALLGEEAHIVAGPFGLTALLSYASMLFSDSPASQQPQLGLMRGCLTQDQTFCFPSAAMKSVGHAAFAAWSAPAENIIACRIMYLIDTLQCSTGYL